MSGLGAAGLERPQITLSLPSCLPSDCLLLVPESQADGPGYHPHYEKTHLAWRRGRLHGRQSGF